MCYVPFSHLPRFVYHLVRLRFFAFIRFRVGIKMEAELCDAAAPKPLVKAAFCLGAESYFVQANKGSLSEQLVSLKEESMVILKDFITKNNAPQDVPDDLVETSSEDDDDILEKPCVKSKKTKLT